MRNLVNIFLYASILLCNLTRNISGVEHLEYTKQSFPPQVTNYLNHLPTIKLTSKELSLKEKSEGIVSFLKEFYPTRNGSPNYLEKLTGEDKLAQRMEVYLREERVIPMRLCGFPFKSTNEEKKVLGKEVDMAEFVSILTLHHICCEIAKLHPPGAKITIISDGCAFQDILHLSPKVLSNYQGSLNQIIEPFKKYINILCPTVEAYRLFVEKNQDANKNSPPINEEIQKDISFFAKAELDCARWEFLPANKPLDAQALARLLAIESARFSLFMKDFLWNYNDYVHLNVHPQTDMSYRCPLSVFYGSKGTPWHLTPVFTAQTVVLEKREEEIKRYRKNNPPPLYVSPPKDFIPDSSLENLKWLEYVHNKTTYETLLAQQVKIFIFNEVKLAYFTR